MFREESSIPFIYLRKYDDDDAAGGSQGVGLDSNLLGKGVIVEYKHWDTGSTNFFSNDYNCQDGYYLDGSRSYETYTSTGGDNTYTQI